MQTPNSNLRPAFASSHFFALRLLPDLVLTESEDPYGLGFAVTLAKRESRNLRQLWTFGTDGTIAPLSSPTKYLTYVTFVLSFVYVTSH